MDDMAYPWHTLNLPDMGNISDAIRTGFDESIEWTYANWIHDGKYHHIALTSEGTLYFDGRRIMENWYSEVDWIVHEQLEHDKRAINFGLLLIYYGIFQFLLGFASLYLANVESMAVGLFIAGALIGGAGLASFILGVIRSGKKM